MRTRMLFAAIMVAATVVRAGDLPDGYMTEKDSGDILAKTHHVALDADISALTPAEHETIAKLIAVGRIFQSLHEQMRHPGATAVYEELRSLDTRLGSPPSTQNLILLYYLAKGPTIRGLDNVRRPFLPVEMPPPGGGLYPADATRDEFDPYFEAHPGSREQLLDLRSVVRRSAPEQIATDLATLTEYPALGVLHPGLRGKLEALAHDAGEKIFYAVPYSVAYAPELTQAYDLLMDAAQAIGGEDAEFAGYLRNRARDLLSGDYESGDASWVTGNFKRLNAQIGAYEVYNDNLFGVKAFFGLNVLVRDDDRTAALREAIKGLQAFENSLPYEPVGWDGTGNKKRVREDIPVGVYNIVADFGQSRGTNTATILPNDSEHARKYGRTILLRYNIMRDPGLFEMRRSRFVAAVADEFAGDLTADGGFYRTLWHEIGHYLGVDRTRDGRDLGVALENASSVLEEMKADLVSLFLVEKLHANGYYSDAQRLDVYASGIRRVLQKVEPRRSQPYQTMQLMQMNYFLEHGLLEFDTKSSRLKIHHDRYPEVVESLLRKVLDVQYAGGVAAANAFIDTYTTWDENLHGVLGSAMRATEKYRYAYVTYDALENNPQ